MTKAKFIKQNLWDMLDNSILLIFFTVFYFVYVLAFSLIVAGNTIIFSRIETLVIYSLFFLGPCVYIGILIYLIFQYKKYQIERMLGKLQCSK